MRAYAYAAIKLKKTTHTHKFLWLNGKRPLQYILQNWYTNIIYVANFLFIGNLIWFFTHVSEALFIYKVINKVLITLLKFEQKGLHYFYGNHKLSKNELKVLNVGSRHHASHSHFYTIVFNNTVPTHEFYHAHIVW